MTEQSPQERFYANCISVEQAVLGALFMDKRAWDSVNGRLEADDFAEPIHRTIFEKASALLADGKPASPMALRTYLIGFQTESFDVNAYVARLCAEAPAPFIVANMIEILSDLSARRRMAIEAEEFHAKALEPQPGETAADAAAALVGKIQALANKSNPEDTRREAGASAAQVIARAKAIAKREIVSDCISTGFADLDSATGGYEPGCMWVVGARPGMGKTVYAVSSARRVARTGVASHVFSFEVPERQLTARQLADLAYRSRKPIPFGSILRGDLDDEDIWCLEDAQKRLAKLPLSYDVASRLSVSEIALRVRAEKERRRREGGRLGVVFLDYLKFIKASDRYRGNRVYEVGEISGGLKQLAKDEGICVVLLAQLNRSLESRDRKDKRPGLSDLRESGDLEADADVVAFIHRESYYIERSAEYRAGQDEAMNDFIAQQNTAEIILGKNRAGPTPTVELFCNVGCSTMASGDRRAA